jgi:hypothetical protein
MSPRGEHSTTQALISIAANLVGEFDLAVLLDGLVVDCAQLLDIDGASLVVAHPGPGPGLLEATASTSADLRHLVRAQLEDGHGPWADCIDTGTAVLAGVGGYASVHALPLPWPGRTLGALGLFARGPGGLDAEDLQLGHTLAHAAGIALVLHGAGGGQAVASARIEAAMADQIVLEQAKGVISERGDLDTSQAFESLQLYARSQRLTPTAVARSVVDRAIPATAVLGPSPEPGVREPGDRLRR